MKLTKEMFFKAYTEMHITYGYPGLDETTRTKEDLIHEFYNWVKDERSFYNSQKPECPRTTQEFARCLAKDLTCPECMEPFLPKGMYDSIRMMIFGLLNDYNKPETCIECSYFNEMLSGFDSVCKGQGNFFCTILSDIDCCGNNNCSYNHHGKCC